MEPLPSVPTYLESWNDVKIFSHRKQNLLTISFDKKFVYQFFVFIRKPILKYN